MYECDCFFYIHLWSPGGDVTVPNLEITINLFKGFFPRAYYIGCLFEAPTTSVGASKQTSYYIYRDRIRFFGNNSILNNPAGTSIIIPKATV